MLSKGNGHFTCLTLFIHKSALRYIYTRLELSDARLESLDYTQPSVQVVI